MQVFFSMVRLEVQFTMLTLMDFLPDAKTRAAIHAPTSKDWVDITSTVFAPTNSSSKQLFSEAHNGLM